MSTGGPNVSGRSPGGREVAYRVFATEFADSTYAFSREDDERAPKYVVSPTGALMNRVFVVGVLTEVDQVNEETVRGRIADPTGVFVVYASQYQPDARATLQELSAPAFVAVTGKANTFVPDGSDRAFTSIRPEAVATVDAETRDHWTVTTADQTLTRLSDVAAALEGGPGDEGVTMALEQYDIDPAYVGQLYQACIESLEVVTGDRERVEAQPTIDATGPSSVPLSDIAAYGAGSSSDAPPEEATDMPGGEPPASTEPEPPEEELDPSSVDEPVVSDDEREAIEAEFGTDFTTGEAIESPDEPIEPEGETIPEESPEGNLEDQDPTTEEGPELSDQIVTLLEELDGGDGVDREALLTSAMDRFEEDQETVADAIRSAMMDGKCYEPAEDVLKPI